MTRLQQLERDALQKRQEVDAAFNDLRARLTVRGLANEAVTLAAPYRPAVLPVYEAVRRHPLIATALLAGAGWLMSQSRNRQSGKKTSRRKLKS